MFDDALFALRRIIRSLDIHSRKLVQRTGLTGPQASLLKLLVQPLRQPLTVGELARRMHLGQTTVTEILDRLENRGLIVRSRSDTDKRRVLVTATSNGELLLRQALPLPEESFAAAFRQLSSSRQTQIASSLRHVATLLDTPDIFAEGAFPASPPPSPSLSGTKPRANSR